MGRGSPAAGEGWEGSQRLWVSEFGHPKPYLQSFACRFAAERITLNPRVLEMRYNN